MATLSNSSGSGDGSWLLTAQSWLESQGFSFLQPWASLTVNDAFWTAGGGATLSGLIIAGSPVASEPTTLAIGSGDLTVSGTLNVVGSLVLQGGTGSQDTAPEIVETGVINVGPAGTLTLKNNVFANYPISVSGGTVDLTGSVSEPNISFNSNTGNVLIKYGQDLDVTGFRAGDQITIKGASIRGALSTNSQGYYQAGTSLLEFEGPTTGPVSYTATPDGQGNTIITTTAEPAATVNYTDLSLGVSSSYALSAGSSTPWQFVDVSSNAEALSTGTPNVSILSVGGTKAVQVFSGQNVIYVGYGNSFLTGGTGDDTFKLALEVNAPATWDTICNFHAGDSVSVSGLIPNAFNMRVDGWDGAAGYQGATVRFYDGGGNIMGSLTFAGQSAAQVEAYAQGWAAGGYKFTA